MIQGAGRPTDPRGGGLGGGAAPPNKVRPEQNGPQQRRGLAEELAKGLAKEPGGLAAGLGKGLASGLASGLAKE